jgi:hypothetical protein
MFFQMLCREVRRSPIAGPSNNTTPTTTMLSGNISIIEIKPSSHAMHVD